jgi:hypothetical protein
VGTGLPPIPSERATRFILQYGKPGYITLCSAPKKREGGCRPISPNENISRLNMYCRYCGKEVTDKAVVCTGCGNPVETSDLKPVTGRPWNILIMAGLIVATLFVPPVGLVFGIMGLMNDARKVQGAVLTTISIFMSLLMIAIILGL